jgi:hypothetical protein
MITRRKALKTLSLFSIAHPLRLRAANDWDRPLADLLNMPSLKEEQGGDESIAEPLEMDLTAVQKASVPERKLEDKKEAKDIAMRMLEISKKFADEEINRNKDEAQVREYLGLFGKSYEDATLPFCASGVSYAACRAFCELDPSINYSHSAAWDSQRMVTFKKYMQEVREYYFFPSPGVAVIRADAIHRKTWVGASETPKKGWLVIYSWHGTGPNHIGIVDDASETALHTVEYNTAVMHGDQRNGGVVARKERKRDGTVMGFVRMY